MMNRLRLAATTENLSTVLRFVRDLLAQNRFPEQRTLEIETAAEEVFVNISRYAYSEGSPGNVELRGCPVSEDEFMLEFEDGGAPFDPTSIPPPDVHLPLSRREPGGLGFFLVRNIVNEVRYRRDGDRNVLTLLIRKNRPLA